MLVDSRVLWAVSLPMKLDDEDSEWSQESLDVQEAFLEELEALAARFGGAVKIVDEWGKVDE